MMEMKEHTRPFLWRISDDYPQNQIGLYDRNHSPDRFMFLQGWAVEEPLTSKPKIDFPCKRAALAQNDCVCSNGGFPIVNTKLKDFLTERATDQIQFFSVDLMCSDGALEGYFLLNAASLVEAIDKGTSNYALIPNTEAIMSFRKLSLHDDTMGDFEIGRDDNYKVYLFVGHALATEIREAGFTGIALVGPDEVV
jgi:hypothetical protein